MTGPGERGATVSERSRRAFARRAWARRWLRVRPLLAVVTALGLVVAAGWVVLASPLLAVDRVLVRTAGAGAVDPAAVKRLAAVPLGRPLARVDLGAIGARVREIPGVASVHVSRSWPSTVVVAVTARTPVAAVADGPTAYRIVDREGVSFQSVRTMPRGLPLITPGSADPNASLHAAVDVVGALPAALRLRVSTVAAPTAEDVTLTLRAGQVVVWGGVARSARKAVVLAALLRYPAHVYDVSAPDAPTTRGKP